MKVFVLVPPIHDQKVTMVEPARARLTVRAGLRLPFEGTGRPQAQGYNERWITITSKHRLIIAVPTHMRLRTSVAVQVRSSWHIPFHTPRRQQECESPPHTGLVAKATTSRMWPDSWAIARTSTSIGNLTRDIPPKLCGKRRGLPNPPPQPELPETTHYAAHQGETQIPLEEVRRRGFQPHVCLSATPGPGDIRAHSGTSGILTSTSHPFPSSTNLVPHRVVLVRPSRVPTCMSSDAPR